MNNIYYILIMQLVMAFICLLCLGKLWYAVKTVGAKGVMRTKVCKHEAASKMHVEPVVGFHDYIDNYWCGHLSDILSPEKAIPDDNRKLTDTKLFTPLKHKRKGCCALSSLAGKGLTMPFSVGEY